MARLRRPTIVPFRRPLLLWFLLAATACAPSVPDRGEPPPFTLSPEQDAFLEELGQRLFLYFQEQTDPRTGLVRDRARADGSPYRPAERADVASIAATGFGLTALCTAAGRGWITESEAAAATRRTLRFFAEEAYHRRGWFYHWMDAKTGERRWQSEVSSIDTALLLAGVLSARQCFPDHPEIPGLASSIYERVDFQWMLDGHESLLSHGWKPESGFLASRWDTYSEDTILYLLAIGSPTRPIPPASWGAIRREPVVYGDYRYYGTAPLFIHQFSHAWVDYRGRRDRLPPRIDYFQNSITATRAHRRFCLDLSAEFPSYSANIWGVTASDSEKGYVAWGGPPRHPAIDGTVVPCAAGGSLMFTPEISLPALQAMKGDYGETVYQRYGFVDAFNPLTGWVNPDVIGIDQGIILLSSENLRGENVWRRFMANPEIQRALEQVQLKK